MPAQGGGAEPRSARGHVPDTTSKRTADVAVIGAGVIGLACAWRAAQHSLEVIVLERQTPAAGATGVAAGMLAPVGELSFGEQRLLELTLAAAHRYPDFVAELEEQSGAAVAEALLDGERIVGVRTEASEEFVGSNVVLATGCWAGESKWLPPHARP